MSKLEELRKLVSEQFEGAEDKRSIETFAALNNKLEEVSKEQEELENRNADLIKSYKDLVKHTSFKDEKPKGQQPDVGIMELPSVEEALRMYLQKGE